MPTRTKTNVVFFPIWRMDLMIRNACRGVATNARPDVRKMLDNWRWACTRVMQRHGAPKREQDAAFAEFLQAVAVRLKREHGIDLEEIIRGAPTPRRRRA